MFESIGKSFNSISSKTLKGVLGSTVKSVCSSENNTLLSTLSKEITQLRNSIDRSNQFIQLFAMLGDTISSTEDAIISDSSEFISDVSDRSDTILEGIKFVQDRFGDMTFTDSFGLIYNFYFKTTIFSSGGVLYRSFLSTKAVPSSVNDCIFYARFGQNNLYFNAKVRTSDFIEQGQTGGNIILRNVQINCDARQINFDGTLLNGYAGTIFDYYGSMDGIGDTLRSRSETMIPTSEAKGKVRYIFDLVKEYMASSELNSIMVDALTAMTGGIDTFKVWLSSSTHLVSNKLDCVRAFITGINNAFISGGFKGAMMYVYEYFKTATSATDSDGLLVFTNNNNLVPAEYVVGMVGQIISTAVAAAGAIIAFFQPIVGLLVSLIGSVAYGIFKSISYDSSATRCGIQMSDRVAINVAPYAISQGSFSLINDPDLLEFVNSTPLFCIDVPGGSILCGPGAYTNGVITELRYEFHPSLENRVNAISSFARYVVQLDSELTGDEYTKTVRFKANGSTLDLDYNYLVGWIESEYNDPNSVSNYIMNNGSNDRLSDKDDALMKKIIISNTWLFLYWLHTMAIEDKSIIYHGTPTNLTGKNYFFQASGTTTFTDVEFNNDDVINILVGLAPLQLGVSDSPSFIELDLSWSNIVTYVFSHIANLWFTIIPVWNVLSNKLYFSDPYAMPNSFDYGLVPAKYNSDTFLTWIILAATVTVAIATVTIAVTLKVRKTVQAKRAEQNKKVENAWDKYKSGEIEYDEYRATVKSANRWHMLVGGTKYDYENYWNGDISAPASLSDNQATTSGILSVLNGPQDMVSIDGEGVDTNELSTIIYRSIVGNPL